MLLKLLLIASSLSIGLESRSGSEACGANTGALVECAAVQSQQITGVYNGVIFGNDGYAYFTLGDKQMRMKTTSFPDPIPTPGTKMTATGCTPDPNWDGGYVCTGLH